MTKSGLALKCVNVLWLLLIVLLIVVALYVSLGRYALSIISENPEKLEKLATQVLGRPVAIRQIEGHWHFLSPSLSVRNLVIGNVDLGNVDLGSVDSGGADSEEMSLHDADDPLTIGFIHLGLNVFRTLWAREVRLSFLHVSGLQVTVVLEDGRIQRIDGLNPLKTAPQSAQTLSPPEEDVTLKTAKKRWSSERVAQLLPRLFQSVLSEKGVIFQNVDLKLHAGDDTQGFHAKQIAMVEWGGHYHIKGEVSSVRDKHPVILSFSSELLGDLLNPPSWHGHFQVKLDRMTVAPWVWQSVQKFMQKNAQPYMASNTLPNTSPITSVPFDRTRGLLGGRLEDAQITAAFQGSLEAARVTALKGDFAVYQLAYQFPEKSSASTEFNDLGTKPFADETPSSSDKSGKPSSDPINQAQYRHVNLALVSSEFTWSGEVPGQWQLALEKTAIQGTDTTLALGPVFVSWKKTTDEYPGMMWVQAQDIAVQALNAVAIESGILPQQLHENVMALKPEGLVKQIEFKRYLGPAAGEKQWQAGLSAEHVGWVTAQSVPGIKGLAVSLAMDEWGGAAWATVEKGELDLRPHLREATALDHFSVPVRWGLRDGELRVESGVALARNADAHGAAMLALEMLNPFVPKTFVSKTLVSKTEASRSSSEVPTSDPNPNPNRANAKEDSHFKGAPRLSLIATVTHGRGASARGYLPTAIMAPPLVKWLDTALVDGHLDSGHFLFEGPLGRAPYGEKTFQMRFMASNATVDYFPPWPKLTAVKGEGFVGIREAEFTVREGKIYDADLNGVTVSLPYFERKSVPYLKIDASAHGQVPDGINVLQNSPLRTRLASFVDDIQGTGALNVSLHMDVPLAQKPKAEVSEEVEEQSLTIATASGTQENDSVVEALAVPVAEAPPDHVQTKVLVNLSNADLAVNTWGLAAKDVSGEIHFETDKGLSSSVMNGVLFDYPVTARINTTAQLNKALMTSVLLEGHVTSEALQKWQALPILTFLSGETDYQAEVVLSPNENQRASELVVTSSLIGMGLDLPTPVGKTPQTAQEFRFRWGFSKPRNVELMSPGVFSLGMRFQETGLDAVKIQLGSDRFVPAREPGVVIVGHTPRLAFSPWLDFIKHYQARIEVANADAEAKPAPEIVAQSDNQGVTQPKIHSDSARTTADPGFDWIEQLRWVDVQTDALGYDEPLFSQATLQLARITNTWRVTVQSAEMSGLMTLPLRYLEPDSLRRFESGYTDERLREQLNAQPISVDIGYLALPPDRTKNAEEKPDSVIDPVMEGPEVEGPDRGEASTAIPVIPSPRVPPTLFNGYQRLPPANVSVRRLLRGNDDWGTWTAQARLTPLGLAFSDIHGSMKGITFSGEGAWEAHVGGPASWLKGTAYTRDLAETLTGLGYPPAMKSEEAHVNLDISWPGRPWDFNRLRADGTLGLSIKNGTLLNINSTASTVRVIGLLNFEMLTRRMQLDFSDVLNRGMQFNVMGGNFEMSEGVLHTQDLKLRGASAQFDIAGRINLNAHTIDQEMNVTLPVTRNLVLPAAATGGLPAAATAFVIEKTLGSQLDKLTSIRFHVTGDWDDPQINPIKRRSSSPRERPGR